MLFDYLENGIKNTPLKRLIDNFYTGKSMNFFNWLNAFLKLLRRWCQRISFEVVIISNKDIDSLNISPAIMPFSWSIYRSFSNAVCATR